MNVQIEAGWKKVLEQEFNKPYFLQIVHFLKKEKKISMQPFILGYRSLLFMKDYDSATGELAPSAKENLIWLIKVLTGATEIPRRSTATPIPQSRIVLSLRPL